MKEEDILNEMIRRYPGLESCKTDIGKACRAIIECYARRGKLLLCGNGGSCSDADHVVGELMKSFEKRRPIGDDLDRRLRSASADRGVFIAERLQGALPAISLNAHASLYSAISNDMDASLVFAQQIAGYGKKDDVLIAMSTSGNSRNIIDAVITASAMGMTVIGMTGESGGKMGSYCDIMIRVPSERTAVVQEFHRPIYHAICRIVENRFFP
jgi:phosphoheptose isomerase